MVEVKWSLLPYQTSPGPPEAVLMFREVAYRILPGGEWKAEPGSEWKEVFAEDEFTGGRVRIVGKAQR